MKKELLTSLMLLVIFCLSLANVSAMGDTTEITQLTSDVSEITTTEDNLAISQDDAILSSSEIYVNSSVTQTGDGSDSNPYASISEAIDSAASGDTIYIASGKYSGNVNVALTIDKELTIKSLDENEVIIDGEGTSWIFYVTSSNLILDGLTFINAYANWGSAVYYESGSVNNIINNSKFINNSAANSAGAVYFDDDEGSKIINTVFENNAAEYNGGAIYYYQNVENTLFDNVTFVNNSAGNNGGAIYYYSGTYDSNFTNVSFGDNKVNNYYGGAILFNVANNINFIDSNFTNNAACSGGGAVIYWSDTDGVNCINTIFENNTALSWGGAILYWANSYNDKFVNSSFKKNNAGQGSAVYVWYGENLNLTDTDFIENTASSTSLSITVDKFNHTISALLVGGNNIVNGIYSSSVDNFIFSNVSYWNNGSVVNSDEITPVYSSFEAGQNLTCEIYDSTTNELVFNETRLTDENGSAIFNYSNVSSQNILRYVIYRAENDYYSSIESSDEFNPVIGDFELLQYMVDNASENDIINLTRNFTYTVGTDTITDGVRINKNNLTINGNGYSINALGQSRIFYVSANTINLNNVTLMGGYSASNGGAIIFSVSSINSTFNNVVLFNNTAKNGGAVYLADASGNEFINSTFVNNSGLYGGAIYAFGIFKDNVISNSNFFGNGGNAIYYSKNTNDNIFENSVFANNARSIYFGAISSNNTFINLTFNNNTASKQGGALYFKKVENNDFVNLTFVNNSAGSDGGAIFFENEVQYVNFTNVAFTDNLAGHDGGAIAFDEDGVEFTDALFVNASFINNTATRYGGSISYANTELTDIKMSDSSFINNSAKNGGAISYVESVIENVDYINISFINNMHSGNLGSTTGGGAISYYGGTTSTDERIINSTFVNNSATYGGGAIFYYADSSTNYAIINTTFVNNFAINYGGAIYLGSMSNGKIDNITCINNTAAAGGAIYFIRSSSNNEISNSLFVNNSVNAIRYYNDPNNDNIINSVFLDNGENEIIYSSSNTLTANNNWFGNNATNYDVKPYVSSNINLTNWLFLNATASNDTVYVGDKNAVKFVLELYNSSSDSIIDEDYRDIAWINLNLTSINGELSQNISFIGEEVGFEAIRIGAGNITAKFLTAEDTIEFTNIKANSSVNIDSINTTYGSQITLIANCSGALGIEAVLLDENGIDISSEYLEIDGFDIIISVIDVGNYTLNVTTIVDENYYSATNSSLIFVNKANSTVRVDDVVINYGDVLNITVNCENVSNISAVIYDDLGEEISSNLTIDGFNIIVNNLTVGNYTINITAIVESNYNESFNSSQIIVNKANATLFVNSKGDINPSVDEVIVVSVPDDIDGVLIYYVNGNLSGIVENNTIVLSNLTEGSYTVLVSLVNDTNYNDCSNFTEFVVAKVNSTVGVSVEDIVVGDNATVFITLPGDATGNVTFSLNNESIVIVIDESTVFGLNGILGMPLVLDALDVGNYSVVVTYNGNSKYNPSNATANFTVSKISDFNITYEYDNGIMEITVPENATGNITVQIGNDTFVSPIENATALLNVSDLSCGDYNITIIYSGDDVYESASLDGNISILVPIVLEAPDVVKYYGGSERFYVYLYDEKGNPLANETVIISINNVSYARYTNENGSASMAINLNPGQYLANVSYGDFTINSTITVNSTVIGNDLVKVFRNDTQYWATFLDSAGNNLANGTEVTFNINGVFYTRIVNENGSAKLNINLNQGEYIITAFNPVTGQNYSNTIKVLPRITENSDLVKYYRNDSQYVVRLIGDDGNPVGAGEVVTFNINGVFYNRTTNESGYAKLNINLYSGEYIITAEYKGCMVSNNITVLPTIYTEDVEMYYKDGTTFDAKLVDGQGNPLANEKIQFNINGVLYYRTTSSLGIASLNINLIVGEYIITSTYDSYNTSNTILIKEIQ